MTTEQLALLTSNLWLRFATNDNGGGHAKISREAFAAAIQHATSTATVIEGTRTRSLEPCDLENFL